MVFSATNLFACVFFLLLYIFIMAGYKYGRANTFRGCGGMFFYGHDLFTRGRVFDHGQDNSQKCTHCNRNNNTNNQC